MKNAIQEVIDQVGYEAVRKSMGPMVLSHCEAHGMYAGDDCPICPKANGTTATDMEHYIDIKQAIDPSSGANPGQVINPTGISERDIERGYEDKDGHRPQS